MAHEATIPRTPVGSSWRSSKPFIVLVVSLSMFSDNFLFSFIVPILPVILQDRMQVAPSRIQLFTSLILSMNALISVIMGPFVGHLSDKSSYKNRLMVISWVTNILGTAITAFSTSLFLLFLGRLIQAIAGSFIWIVGMAILGNTVGSSNLAKTFGFVILFATGGLLCGPAVSGALYKFTSYLITWLSAFAVLLLGTVLQLLVIAPSESDMYTAEESANTDEENSIYDSQQYDDTDPLLPRSPQSTSDTNEPNYLPYDNRKTAEATTKEVWTMMLRKRRVITALAADSLFAMIIASFETTIPIHVKTVFHWETLQTGILFLLVQAPSLLLVVPIGWLKDKFGMQYPVSVGYLLLAPSLWLLGTPGQSGFEWINKGDTGRIVYVLMLLAIGIWRTLPLGFGAVEILRGVNEIASKRPGIFGPNGGYSRAFTLSNITWKLAMFVGPLISGALTDALGYYYLNLLLAILCLMMGIATWIVLKN